MQASGHWGTAGQNLGGLQGEASTCADGQPGQADPGAQRTPSRVSTVFQEGVCAPSRSQVTLIMGQLGKVQTLRYSQTLSLFKP